MGVVSVLEARERVEAGEGRARFVYSGDPTLFLCAFLSNNTTIAILAVYVSRKCVQ